MQSHSTPVRPRPLRLIDGLGRGLARLGWRSFRLDVAELLTRARRSTRLEDFGNEAFMPGLRLLVESLDAEARLSPFGRFVAQRQLVEVLVHRLRLADYRRTHPEVAEQVVERPLLVLGLPRSGTTLLYELLAQDPSHRAPLTWEFDDPCPPSEVPLGADDPRVVKCERRMAALRSMAPGFQAIHPIGALLPQECLVATAYAFLSVRFELCFDIVSYQRWLGKQDLSFAYQTHFEVLQQLQSRRAPRRWVLKSPGHLGAFDTILERYPDAMMVQTHRDPQRVIPSLASLYANMRSIATEDLQQRRLGPQTLETWSAYLEEGIRRRASRPDAAEQILDVHYRELVADPIGSVRRIYRHFDLPLENAVLARMRAYLAQNPRHRHGVHRYDHASYGLEPAAIDTAFKRYCDYYGVERERAGDPAGSS